MLRFPGLLAAGALLMAALGASSCSSNESSPGPKGTGGRPGHDGGVVTDAGPGGAMVGAGGAPQISLLCGNGAADDPLEECDDGNNVDGDGCDNNCHFTCTKGKTDDYCSDNDICTGEERCSDDHHCLPAEKPAPDGTLCGVAHRCTAGVCHLADAVCGDGLVVPPTEECDGDEPGCTACRFTCLSYDSTRDCSTTDPCAGNPKCDDVTHTCVAGQLAQNLVQCGDGKACIDGVCTDKYCSNGKVEKDNGEECDDGNRAAGDGCEPDCTFTCKSDDPKRDCHSDNACVNSGTCDDKVTHKCSALTPKTAGTACGSGNKNNCVEGNCISPVCGDGFPAAGVEQCDDGNTVPGDGCETSCKASCSNPATDCGGNKTPPCRKPNCTAGKCGSDPDSSKNGTPCKVGTGGTGVDSTCQDGRCGSCGDGNTDTGEDCDDGNFVNGDGCDANCTFSCKADGDCPGSNACSDMKCDTTNHVCKPSRKLSDGASCGTGKVCVSNSCRPSLCGDGVTASNEECDPPNTIGCDARCKALELCDLNGDWALKVSLQVHWGGGQVLEEADGKILQWARLHITHAKNSVALTTTIGPCALQIPDFHTLQALGNEYYGTTFDTKPFQKLASLAFPGKAALSNLAPGANIDMDSVSIMLGYTTTPPADPFGVWPTSQSSFTADNGYVIADQDGDGHPGITATVKSGPVPGIGSSYSNPPWDASDATNPKRGDLLYLVIRQIAEQHGVLDSCESLSGNTKAQIENHLIGCRDTAGGDCTTANLIDAVRPTYIVNNQASSFVAKRVTLGASCDAIVKAVP